MLSVVNVCANEAQGNNTGRTWFTTYRNRRGVARLRNAVEGHQGDVAALVQELAGWQDENATPLSLARLLNGRTFVGTTVEQLQHAYQGGWQEIVEGLSNEDYAIGFVEGVLEAADDE